MSKIKQRPQSKQSVSEHWKHIHIFLSCRVPDRLRPEDTHWWYNIPAFRRAPCLFHTLTPTLRASTCFQPILTQAEIGTGFLLMNRFPFQAFLKPSLFPERLEPFQEWLWVVYMITKEFSPGRCPVPSYSMGQESQLCITEWGGPPGCHLVGMHFPKCFQEAVFLQDAARCRRKRVDFVANWIGKFHFMGLGFQRPALGKPSYGARSGRVQEFWWVFHKAGWNSLVVGKDKVGSLRPRDRLQCVWVSG